MEDYNVDPTLGAPPIKKESMWARTFKKKLKQHDMEVNNMAPRTNVSPQEFMKMKEENERLKKEREEQMRKAEEEQYKRPKEEPQIKTEPEQKKEKPKGENIIEPPKPPKGVKTINDLYSLMEDVYTMLVDMEQKIGYIHMHDYLRANLASIRFKEKEGMDENEG